MKSRIKKKNKYKVLTQPLTCGGIEYKVYIKIRKHINPQHPQAGLYAFRAHKKMVSFMRENHLTMKFYDITTFSISV